MVGPHGDPAAPQPAAASAAAQPGAVPPAGESPTAETPATETPAVAVPPPAAPPAAESAVEPPPAEPPPAAPAAASPAGGWVTPGAAPGTPTAWGPPPGAHSPGSTAPTAPGGTNGLAVAALICGLLTPLFLIPGVLAVIFGVIALAQARRRGQKGTGLAIGGIVATAVWVIIGVATLVIMVLMSTADRDRDTGEIISGGKLPVNSLQLGDCIDNVSESESITLVDAVPCSQPHEAQVYAKFTLPAGPWPGLDELFDQAEEGCLNRLADDLPQVYDDLSVEVFYLHPHEQGWRVGDREIICFVHYPDRKDTGSVFD